MPTTPALPAPSRPLWQRMLRRRLKFLGVLAALVLIVFGGSYLFAPQWLLRADIARKAMAAGLDTHTVQAGDTRWSYYEGGQGQTLVLLHGMGDDKAIWLDVAKVLTPHFHVVIPDLPGWGASSRLPGSSYRIEDQAARLQDFVQALGLTRFVLVGHSLGGAIAGVYAAEHPDRVAGLALLDAFGLKFKENAVAREVLAGGDPFVFDDRAGFARAAALVMDKPLDLPGRFVDVLVARNRRDHAFIERTVATLRDPAEYLALQDRLGQLTMPVLGLWCRDDKVTDISALDSLSSGLSDASSIGTSTLIGCNHLPMLEKPAETAQILTNFALSH